MFSWPGIKSITSNMVGFPITDHLSFWRMGSLFIRRYLLANFHSYLWARKQDVLLLLWGNDVRQLEFCSKVFIDFFVNYSFCCRSTCTCIHIHREVKTQALSCPLPLSAHLHTQSFESWNSVLVRNFKKCDSLLPKRHQLPTILDLNFIPHCNIIYKPTKYTQSQTDISLSHTCFSNMTYPQIIFYFIVSLIEK